MVFSKLVAYSFLFFSFECLSETIKHDCMKDLNEIPSYLLENDAGGLDSFNDNGQLHFSESFENNKNRIDSIITENDCLSVINTYLKSWRQSHLSAISLLPKSEGAKSSSNEKKLGNKPRKFVEISFLSSNTVYIKLPNFQPYNRDKLLAVLKSNEGKLMSAKNWIVDVRGNHGGSDSSYYPILPWILINETISIDASWLVTKENIKAQKNICNPPQSKTINCKEKVDKILARMEGVKLGDFVSQNNSGSTDYSQPEPHYKAQRVALLIDGKCASSCEEFVLTMRQSFNVKTLGQRTAGSLDYANLRPHKLPSGKRELWYATSRSNRLPYFPVDNYGIPADIYLPGVIANDDDIITKVKDWIEGGSLSEAN